MTTAEVIALITGVVGIPGLGAGFWKLYGNRRKDKREHRQEEREDRRELIQAVKDSGRVTADELKAMSGEIRTLNVTMVRVETKLDSMPPFDRTRTDEDLPPVRLRAATNKET